MVEIKSEGEDRFGDLVATAGGRVPAEKLAKANQIILKILDERSKITVSFFNLGKYLCEFAQGYYSSIYGFQNVADFAEDRFGIKKSTVYDLMAVYERAHDRQFPEKMDGRFVGREFGQIVEITRCRWASDSLIEKIEPDDSVRAVREYVRAWNKSYEHGDARSLPGANLKEYFSRCAESAPKAIATTVEIEEENDESVEYFSRETNLPDQLPGQIEIVAKCKRCENAFALDEFEIDGWNAVPTYGIGFEFCPYCGRKLPARAGGAK